MVGNMHGFSEFVGNQQAIMTIKKSFPGSTVTIIVGRPTSGKTYFAKCLREHFSDMYRFVDLNADEGLESLKQQILSTETRKAGPMEALISASSANKSADKSADKSNGNPVRIVIDDVDNTERGTGAFIEAYSEKITNGNGFLLITDLSGLRKLSNLKKKGCLVVTLTSPGKDAVTRWARNKYLGESPEEDDLMLLKRLIKACGNSICMVENAFKSGKSMEVCIKECEMDALNYDGAQDLSCNLDNMSMMHTLFVRGGTPNQLMDVVSTDGGSMIGQLMWHNAPVCGISDDAYVAALDKAIDGMVIERAGHVRHEKWLCTIGHMLSIRPFCRITGKLDKLSLTYTSTMAQGGARAVARKALTKQKDVASVSEKAYGRK
jgi:hypothetical protein